MNAGWYVDPTKRHAHRYYDGTRWTQHVADGSVVDTDPQPIDPALPVGADPSPATTATGSLPPPPPPPPPSPSPSPQPPSSSSSSSSSSLSPPPVVNIKQSKNSRLVVVGVAVLVLALIVGVIAVVRADGSDNLALTAVETAQPDLATPGGPITVPSVSVPSYSIPSLSLPSLSFPPIPSIPPPPAATTPAPTVDLGNAAAAALPATQSAVVAGGEYRVVSVEQVADVEGAEPPVVAGHYLVAITLEGCERSDPIEFESLFWDVWTDAGEVAAKYYARHLQAPYMGLHGCVRGIGYFEVPEGQTVNQLGVTSEDFSDVAIWDLSDLPAEGNPQLPATEAVSAGQIGLTVSDYNGNTYTVLDFAADIVYDRIVELPTGLQYVQITVELCAGESGLATYEATWAAITDTRTVVESDLLGTYFPASDLLEGECVQGFIGFVVPAGETVTAVATNALSYGEVARWAME